MRIRLLSDVLEEGKVKTTIRLRKKQCIAWFQDTEIEVSEVTGQNLIDQGVAVDITAEAAAAAAAASQESQP